MVAGILCLLSALDFFTNLFWFISDFPKHRLTSIHHTHTHTHRPTHTQLHRTQMSCAKATQKCKLVENKSTIKIFSNSEFVRQTASTKSDVSDIYIRSIYPAGSNICVIQRGFYYIRIRAMYSQNLLMYLHIRGTPWLDTPIITGCFSQTHI
jgi:hypothetical protein